MSSTPLPHPHVLGLWVCVWVSSHLSILEYVKSSSKPPYCAEPSNKTGRSVSLSIPDPFHSPSETGHFAKVCIYISQNCTARGLWVLASFYTAHSICLLVTCSKHACFAAVWKCFFFCCCFYGSNTNRFLQTGFICPWRFPLKRIMQKTSRHRPNKSEIADISQCKFKHFEIHTRLHNVGH